MDPYNYYLMQAFKRQRSRLEHSQAAICQMTNVYHIAQAVNRAHVPAQLKPIAPLLQQTIFQLRQEAERKIESLFDGDPSAKYAYDCWRATQGWSPRLAKKYHRQWQILSRPEPERTHPKP